MAKKNPHLSSTLESLLREDGTYEDVKNQTIKSVLAYKLKEACLLYTSPSPRDS